MVLHRRDRPRAARRVNENGQGDEDENFREWRERWRFTGRVFTWCLGAIGALLLFLVEMIRFLREVFASWHR